MKTLQTYQSFAKMNEANLNESFNSFYFHKDVFDGHRLPGKDETSYAVVTHNKVEVNGAKVSLKVEGDHRIGSSFRPEVLSVFDNEADAKVEYDKVVKAGGSGANLSFSFGAVTSKGTNVPYTQIEGYTAKGKVK